MVYLYKKGIFLYYSVEYKSFFSLPGKARCDNKEFSDKVFRTDAAPMLVSEATRLFTTELPFVGKKECRLLRPGGI